MHALHRPHLPRAVMITVIAAALATALALALATRVNDLSFTRMPTGAAAKRPTVQAQAASREWTLSPFKPLLSARGLAVGVGTAKPAFPQGGSHGTDPRPGSLNPSRKLNKSSTFDVATGA